MGRRERKRKRQRYSMAGTRSEDYTDRENKTKKKYREKEEKLY